MKNVVMAAAALVLVWSSPLHVRAAQGGQLFVDYAPPPPTIEAFFQAAELVVVATLQNPTYEGGSGARPTTRFKAAVSEVLKDSGKRAVGTTIDVMRFGGRRQTAKGVKDVDEVNFRRWSEGMKLMVFLRWNPQTGAYAPLGPDSAYQLDPIINRVRAFGRGAVAKGWNGRDVTRVLSEAKTKAKVGRPVGA